MKAVLQVLFPNHMLSGVARNQQKGGHWYSRGTTFSLERGAIDACGAKWASVREKGAHLRHLGASLMPMTYMAEPNMKVMGRLHLPWNLIAALGLFEMSWY